MSIKGSIPFIKDYKEFKRQFRKQKDFTSIGFYPLFADRYDSAGVASGHYFHQDLYVARKIFEANPSRHVDVGSRVDGFVAHVASFREIEIIDIRHIESKSKNIKFMQADLMAASFNFPEKTPSLSCLHAIEHFGLGRYGDPIDYFGYIKAIENIHAILEKGGRFYFSVPIGPQRIEYNAHRVFSLSYLFKFLSNYFEIEYLSIVDDAGNLHKKITITPEIIKNNFNCNYGCGIFELIKKS
jgi:SAM-dependent methyltransferase